MAENQVIDKKAKCIMVGRLPRKEGDDFKTCLIKFFDNNDAHKTGEFPTEELEFSNIENVRIRRLNVSYYLEGNDILVNDLSNVRILKKYNYLVIRGFQGGDQDTSS
ncbi:MAG: hypothetical protein ACE5DM_01890 [Candidatus Nanoarchaeia archaeon]